MRSFIALTIFLLPALLHAQLEQRIREAAQRHYPKTGFSGVVGVVDTNSMFTVSFGFEDREKSIPISQYSKFSLASVTKSFVGFAMLHYVNEGLINGEDTIGKWFPELQPALQKVTVRQMANHTAAIHDFFSLTENHAGLTDSMAYELLIPLDTTAYEPGKMYGYSNTHFVLLGMILEAETGQSIEEVIRKLILEPAGMSNSGFIIEGERGIPSLLPTKRAEQGPTFTSASGGLVSNGTDMMSFGRAMITEESFQHWLQLALENSDVYDRDTTWTNGYGWFFTQDELGSYAAHSGKSKNGFMAYHRCYYEQGTYYFLLTNHRDLAAFQSFREEIGELLGDR